jgi:hypothetical protein
MVATSSAPRLHDRLRALIDAAPGDATAAEVTRAAGQLAWALGVPRPSYQRVRSLLAARRSVGHTVSTPAPGVAHYVVKTLDFLYQYPGPGLRDWYLDYIHGRG